MTQKQRKTQERTAVTRGLLLAAAEQAFARTGYEKALMEEIAAAAGFSKGALYAHFQSKEDLFLALYEVKTIDYLARARQALDGSPTREGKIAAFRCFYVDMLKDRDWALITLEVKLLIRRDPVVRAKLRQVDKQVGGTMDAIVAKLFGTSSRAAAEALGGILSALVLQSDLEPEALPERKMRALLGRVFDSLLAGNRAHRSGRGPASS